MLHSNPSQQVKVGWQGMPFTFIAHAGLPPGYSHTCQTPWSVFLDGSDAPIPSAGAPAETEPNARRSLAEGRVTTQGRRMTRTDKVHRAHKPKAPCGRQKEEHAAELADLCWAHTGFLLPISSTL